MLTACCNAKRIATYAAKGRCRRSRRTLRPRQKSRRKLVPHPLGWARRRRLCLLNERVLMSTRVNVC